ncbi:MAG: DUF6051 family protein [Bacteroidetes bacterium]|nr:DUF6051 family protein [Bacteroidota bacterium]
MGYLEDYNLLKSIYRETEEQIKIPGSDIYIRNFEFDSTAPDFFPDNDYIQQLFKRHYDCLGSDALKEFSEQQIFGFECNTKFVYPVYINGSRQNKGKVIIMLHGLNESNWDKYHPWAKALAERTGNPVIMFPISFHINRRPSLWTQSRQMNALSKGRRTYYNELAETSFVNAAISTRLQFASELFFWSGFRTFNDILRLTETLKNGGFDFAAKGTKIDFLGYSIGAFLVEVLMMSRYSLYADSGALLFCGGPTMDLMYPASKYIYDTETEKTMNRFYIRDFENRLPKDEYLNNFFTKAGDEALAFRSMLNTERFREKRLEMLTRMRKNVHAVCLTKDSVMPPDSVRISLQGENNAPGIRVTELDFPFEYDHVSPFPLGENIKEETEKAFRQFVDIAAERFCDYS